MFSSSGQTISGLGHPWCHCHPSPCSTNSRAFKPGYNGNFRTWCPRAPSWVSNSKSILFSLILYYISWKNIHNIVWCQGHGSALWATKGHQVDTCDAGFGHPPASHWAYRWGTKILIWSVHPSQWYFINLMPHWPCYSVQRERTCWTTSTSYTTYMTRQMRLCGWRRWIVGTHHSKISTAMVSLMSH